MGHSAVIFPGQGSQAVGMGRDVSAISPRAREIYARANDTLRFDVTECCFQGPAERLERTDIQQPAIFVTSAAIWEAYLEAGGTRDHFSYAAGLSLGEYTALYIAGAVGFEDALKLVHLRGRLMQQAAAFPPSGMVSLIGADKDTAESLCDASRGEDVLVAANFNCPGQVVISGSQAACARAVEAAGQFGCRAVPLAVAGAFHSPLMQSAAEELASALSSTSFVAPSMRVIANVDATYHGAGAGIRESLCRQLTQPVLWQRCMEQLIADGVDQFMEIGPGRVLTGLMRKINRQVTATNISTADALRPGVVSPSPV